MMSPFLQDAGGGARIAEHHRRVRHRRRPDDQKIDIAAAFEDGGARRRAQFVFFHAGLARATMAFMASSHSLPALRTQSSSSALWIDEQLVQEAFGEDQLRVGKILAQHIVLVDRQVVA